MLPVVVVVVVYLFIYISIYIWQGRGFSAICIGLFTNDIASYTMFQIITLA